MDAETQAQETAQEADTGVEFEKPSPVDLNRATAAELKALPGVGAALARRIVAYREEQGDFGSPEDVVAVAGISHAAYERLAGRLIATPSEPSSPLVDEDILVEEVAAESPSAELPPPVLPPEAVFPPPATPALGLEPSPEAGEAAPEARVPAPAEVSTAAPALEEKPPLEAELGPAGEQESRPPAPEGMPEKATSPAPTEPKAIPPAPAPVRKPPGRRAAGRWNLSWLWSALLGGLLGMLFTLLVLSGINGSLDIGNSQAVLDIRNHVDNLAAETDSLRTEVDGLRERLDVLDSLAARVEGAESAVDTLSQATTALEEQIEAVEGDLAGVSEELSATQTQVGRMTTFFSQLQALLQEFFGDEPASDATPESPAETPTPAQ